MCKAILLVFALIPLALFVARPVSAQPRCGEQDVWENGTPAFLEFTAWRSAHVEWSATVGNRLGEAYKTWNKARNRRTTCLKDRRQYICTASAKPCRG